MIASSARATSESWSKAASDVIVATHYWSPGWASALDDFLKPRADRYRAISHPLFADGSVASYRCWSHGQRRASFDVPGIRDPSRYLRDVGRTIRWSRTDGAADLFIAGDNLLALAGLWLRRRGLVKAVVMYAIDFVPRRFANPIANRAYHAVDRLAGARSDVVWNTASGLIEGRRLRDGDRRTAPQIIVPIGAYTKRIAERPMTERRPRLAYLGHLLDKQGLQVVIEALPRIVERFPEVDLLVIGDGPYRPELEALARRLGVGAAVEFAGFSDDHMAIERRLLDCRLGVAPYKPGPENYSQFQDLPGKIVTYLACGLPVITTTVPRHGHLLEQAGAGRVVDYSPAAMASAIGEYLAAPDGLAEASKAARKLGLAYDWDEIFDRALQETVRLSPALSRETRREARPDA